MARGFATALVCLTIGALTAADGRAGLPAPPAFKWQRCPPAFCETGWYASPAAADVDGDGQVDALWGGYTLMAVNGSTGALEWHYAPIGGDRIWPDVALVDLNGDHRPEIVAAFYSQLVVLGGSGTPLPSWPAQPFASGEMRTLAVADLDGDHVPEILVADAASTRTGQWTVLEPDAAVRPGWPRLQTASGAEGYAAGCYNENVAVADLDGDGRGELVASSDVHYLASFQDDGTPIPADLRFATSSHPSPLWGQVNFNLDEAEDIQGYSNCTGPSDPRPNFASSPPAIADLDGDGSLEIVVVGRFQDCSVQPQVDLFEEPYVLRPDRTRWAAGSFDWTVLPTPIGSAAPLAPLDAFDVIQAPQPNPVLADLDGDGQKEILFPSYDGRLHALWLDKTEHYGWPFVLAKGDGAIRYASPPAVVDLDHDGKAEVIFTTWTQAGSNKYGELVILDYQGHLLGSVELPHAMGDTWGGALAAPTVANIDGDPDLEVLVGTADAGLVAYDLPGTAGARVLWGTGRGSFARTGFVPEPEVSAGGAASILALALLALGSRSSGARRPAGVPASAASARAARRSLRSRAKSAVSAAPRSG